MLYWLLLASSKWPLEFVGKDNVSLIIVITIVWIQKSFIFLTFLARAYRESPEILNCIHFYILAWVKMKGRIIIQINLVN